MNINWIQISNQRFVSADGNFSITPIYKGEVTNEFRYSLHATYNRKDKTYNYTNLESAFWGAQNIWNGGRG